MVVVPTIKNLDTLNRINYIIYSIEILQHNVYTYIISLILEPFLKPIISVDVIDKTIQILNYYDYIDWVNNDYI